MKELESIKASLAAGPTSGPWESHLEETYFVTGPDLGRVAMMMNLKGRHGLGGRRAGQESASNCRLIAACNPDAMQKILAHIDAQAAEIERLREKVQTLAWAARDATSIERESDSLSAMREAMKETP